MTSKNRFADLMAEYVEEKPDFPPIYKESLELLNDLYRFVRDTERQNISFSKFFHRICEAAIYDDFVKSNSKYKMPDFLKKKRARKSKRPS